MANENTTDKTTLISLVQSPIHGDGEGFETELFERQKVAILTHTDPESIQSLPPERIESEVVTTPPPAESIVIPTVTEEIPDRKLSKAEMDELRRAEREYRESLSYTKDAIAPSFFRAESGRLMIGDTLVRSFFAHSYPDFLEGNWLSPLINWDVKFDMSIFVYPDENDRVMKYLKKRLTELGSQRAINMDK